MKPKIDYSAAVTILNNPIQPTGQPVTQPVFQQNIATLAANLEADLRTRCSGFGDDIPVLMPIRPGANMFESDLCRYMSGSFRCEHSGIYATRKYDPHKQRVSVSITPSILPFQFVCRDRVTVVIDDLVRTGETLKRVVRYVRNKLKARDVVTVVAGRVPNAMTEDVAIDHYGVNIRDGFYVGYGLHWEGQFANLPHFAEPIVQIPMVLDI